MSTCMVGMAGLVSILLLVSSLTCAVDALRFPSQLSLSSSLRSGNRARRLSTIDPTYDWEVRWFEQTLDHFTARNATFRQKYLFARQWWGGAKESAPIFLYCGNEGDIEWFAENSGFVWESARLFGALVVFPEHRYYGDSMPYGSSEAAYKDSESLTYLNSEQALADYVVLITELKRELSAESSPVVLFGGSYGGMLAAWFRLKYPHIAIGAIASSAPILQFEDMASPFTFYDTLTSDFKSASETCFVAIKNSWEIVQAIGKTKAGLRNLTEQFKICSHLQNSDELEGWMESAYSYAGMVDYPYPANFTEYLPGFPVNEMCKVIDATGGGSNGLDGIAAAMNLYYNYSGAVKCFDLSSDPHGLDGWDYQACTEMEMPMSIREGSIFPAYNWSSYNDEIYCMEEFGVKPRPHWIGEEYGGQSIKSVLKHFGSNIVFSNGLLDPWSGGGVLEDISKSIVALVTKLGAHHLDLRAATAEDPIWLVEQRLIEVQHIRKWLAEYYLDRRSAQ